jgi:DNA-binding HxlR family transcriptional regulator
MKTAPLSAMSLLGCPVTRALQVIGGKWKLFILFHLMTGTRRFGELRRLIPGVTQQMLTAQLRELEADGLVLRKVHPVVPPHVDYSLTPLGRDLQAVTDALFAWGGRLPDADR